jgi:enoyl-CoA hydratase/carnithine racemase
MAEEEKIRYEVNKKVAVITLNRPQSLNALDLTCVTRLIDLYTKAEKDSTVRAVLLTGAGEKAFCAGLDTKMLGNASSEEKMKVITEGSRLAKKIFHMRKPTAVAINGLAMGWGMLTSMFVDFRFVADDPRIFLALSELDAGVFPATAAAFGAVMNFGVKMAQEMIQTGKRYTIPEFQALHFITAVYPRAQLIEESLNFFTKITRRPPNLLYMSKSIINMHAARIFDDAIAQEQEFITFLKDHQDEEEVAKYLEDQWKNIRKR